MKSKGSLVLVTFYDLDSFAVHTLHAVLQKAGFSAHSVFFKSLNINSTVNVPTEADISALVGLIKKLDPVIVGISFRSTFFKLASTVTAAIRKDHDALIVWGGIHPTIKPAQCVEIADIVCVGEGEGAIVELAERLAQGQSIDDIDNLWVRKNGTVVKNELRCLMQDLDALPFPDFSTHNKYFIEDGAVESIIAPLRRTDYSIMTSRGCPFRCTYCYNNIAQRIYRQKGKYVRRRSVGNVIEELKQAKKTFRNLHYISFLDDLFTFDKKWVAEFGEQYKKHIRLPFYCHIHPRFADEDMIKVLKSAGCAGITIGIQTGSERSRFKYFERHETNDQIVSATQILNRQEIDCTYDLIMDNPLETDEDKRETFNLLLRLPRPFKLCVHSLTHFPETKLTNLLLERKIISEQDIEDQKQKSYERWVPALDLDRAREDMFWDNLYYLTQKKYMPVAFLVWLSNRNFLKQHPKPLTFLLRLTSFSIYTIRSGSKLDGLRWAVLTILNKPHLLFKKRSWFFLGTKIKSKWLVLMNARAVSDQ